LSETTGGEKASLVFGIALLGCEFLFLNRNGYF